jgi:hypothetical protein
VGRTTTSGIVFMVRSIPPIDEDVLIIIESYCLITFQGPKSIDPLPATAITSGLP